MSRPLVFVGPSGIGKGTIIRGIMAANPGCFEFSVSHTTRAPRPGEVDGRDYHFVSRERMLADIEAGLFLEHVEVHGNLYGTSYAAIEHIHSKGKVCILDLNVDGALRLHASDFNPFILLLRPVSVEALEARLRGRGTEDEATIQRRMQTTQEEMRRFDEHQDVWTRTVINDKLEDTMKVMNEIIKELFATAEE